MFTSIVCMVLMGEVPAIPQSEAELQKETSTATAKPAFSCAHNALYLLLRLLNRPASLDEVKLQLHVGKNGEASMAEVQQAAAHFGVSLVGRRLSGKDVTNVDVPLIVLLQNPTTLHGHYLVSRWIDDRQTVQALDAPKEPYLIPKSDVVAYQGPALLYLIPIRPDAAIWRGIGALALGVSALVIFAVVWRFRGDLIRSPYSRRSPAA